MNAVPIGEDRQRALAQAVEAEALVVALTRLLSSGVVHLHEESAILAGLATDGRGQDPKEAYVHPQLAEQGHSLVRAPLGDNEQVACGG